MFKNKITYKSVKNTVVEYVLYDIIEKVYFTGGAWTTDVYDARHYVTYSDANNAFIDLSKLKLIHHKTIIQHVVTTKIIPDLAFLDIENNSNDLKRYYVYEILRWLQIYIGDEPWHLKAKTIVEKRLKKLKLVRD